MPPRFSVSGDQLVDAAGNVVTPDEFNRQSTAQEKDQIGREFTARSMMIGQDTDGNAQNVDEDLEVEEIPAGESTAPRLVATQPVEPAQEWYRPPGAPPSIEEFLDAARPINPDATDRELAGVYRQEYPDAPKFYKKPDLAAWMTAAKEANPGVAESDLKSTYTDVYGAPQKDYGDVARGFVESVKQIPQLAYGLAAGAGAVGEKLFGEGGGASALKRLGIDGHNRISADIAKDSKLSDSLNYSYAQAKEGNYGALVDWLQHGVGYVGGQAMELLATGVIGGIIGKATVQPIAKTLAAKLVEKESTRLAAAEGVKLSAEQLTQQAVKNVAANMGQTLAVGATAVGMEGGEIFGDLTSSADQAGRQLTGSELAKAGVMTAFAGALEFAGDKIGLDLILGKSPITKFLGKGDGLGGKLLKGAEAGVIAAVPEAATEFGQTVVEEWGKGKEPIGSVGPDTLRQAQDAAGIGALGGALVGGTAGALRPGGSDEPPPKPSSESSPVPPSPQQTIEIIMSTDGVKDAIKKSAELVEAPPITTSQLNETIGVKPTYTDSHLNADQVAFERIMGVSGVKAGNGTVLKVLDPRTLPETNGPDDGMSVEKLDALEPIAQVFGKRIVVFQPGGQVPEGVFWQSQDPTRIYLSGKSNSTDAFSVLAHEAMHTMQGTPFYEAFKQVVAENRTPRAVDIARERHDSPGRRLSDSKILEETAADIGMTELQKPEVWEKVFTVLRAKVGDQQAVVQVTSFIDSLKEIIERIKSLITARPIMRGGKSLTELYVTELERVQDALAQAVGETLHNKRFATPQQAKEAGGIAMSRRSTTDRTLIPRDVADTFASLAGAQRGQPEAAMRAVQKAAGNGLLSQAVEHTGDLLHRMTEGATRGMSGKVYVREKVDKVLRLLTHAYGFENEHAENMANNASYTKTDPAIRRQGVSAALTQYVADYKSLPVYNRAQWLARAAAIAVGELRIKDAVAHLQALKKIVDGDFAKEAFSFSREGKTIRPYLHPVPAKFIGTQVLNSAKIPDFDLYDLDVDLPGHPKGSSVSDVSMREEGYRLVPSDLITLEESLKAKKPKKAPAERSGTAKLTHYSKQTGLTEIDPAKRGTGQIGAERARLERSGKDYLPRSYFYRAGTKIEPRFKGLTKYQVEVPESSLVDLATLTGTPTEREQAAKKAGYKGYYNSESSMPNVVAMFDPVQTTSAQPSSAQPSVSREELTSDPLFSPRTWVSQIERVLEQKMPKSASAAQIKGILSPQNGIKPDELEAMDFDAYLASKEKFDKHNVLEWVKAHQIQPEKVTFSEQSKEEYFKARAKLEDAYDEPLRKALTSMNDAKRATELAFQTWQEDRSNDLRKRIANELSAEWVAATSAYEKLRDEYETEVANLSLDDVSTKYDSWTLPGGTNYQEVFVTLPARSQDLTNWRAAFVKRGDYDFWEVKADRQDGSTYYASMDPDGSPTAEKAIADAKILESKHPRDGWQDGHEQYDSVANPIVRLRMNDRTTGDGRRLLFLEEVQPPHDVEQKKMPKWAIKRWREIGLKQALRIAADGLYDAIGWTTGAQQADRYSLRERVEKLSWYNPSTLYGPSIVLGMREVHIALPNGRTIDSAINDKGLILSSTDNALQGKLLSDVLGARLSDRILKEEKGTATPDDLALGGEGLMKVYDQDLVHAANTLAKKWGVKVGSSAINERPAVAKIPSTTDYRENALPGETPIEYAERTKTGTQGDRIHTLPVTDAMKTAAKDGLPLFAPKPDMAKSGDKYEKWFEQLTIRMQQESIGQYVLDSLDERGRSPKTVVQEFWDKTYPVLPPAAQQRFQRYITRLTGFTIGSVIASNAKREDVIGKTWEELYPSAEAPTTAEYLEGTERGLIALMELGNMRRSGTEQSVLGLPLFAPKAPVAAAFAVEPPSSLDKLVRIFQDKTIDIKRIVEAVKDAGHFVEDELNPVLKEEMYMARTAQRTKDATTNEFLPLMTAMRLNKVEIEQLDRYLHARHVIKDKVNAHLQSINPDLAGTPEYDHLAGITDAEARKILAGVNAAVMEPLAKRVDAIVEKTRDLMVAYGLEKQDTIDNWRKFYTSYVPLHREGFEDEGHPTGTGRSVRGSTVKERTGSTLGVSNVLANVAQARDQIITRGEKQRPVIAMAGLLMQYPNPEIATLDKPAQIETTDPVTGLKRMVPGDLTNYTVPMVRRFDPTQGKVVSMPDPTYKGRDNVVNFRVDGEDYAIVFNERNDRAMEAAKAFKELNTAQLTGVMAAVAPYTRYEASINTQYNPIFGIINFIRDASFATLTLGSTPLAGKRLSVLNNTLHLLRGIYQDARAVRKGLHPTSATAALWELFQHVGGPTGYRDLFFSSTERAEELERMLDPNSWATVHDPQSLGRRIEETGVMKWLSDYNLTMENAIRLGVFKTAIELRSPVRTQVFQVKVGNEWRMSELQAASLAKNATVNFNKKGQYGAQLGSLYAFFNANVQGTARILETLFDRQKGGGFRLSAYGKKLVAGGILVGVLQAFALTMAGFGDDDPPEYIKARNLVIPIPGTQKGYGLIPMPLGFNLLPNIGRMAAEAVRAGVEGKDLNVAKRAAALVSAMYGTFSPMGGTGGVIQELSPTAIDPLVALESNKDWTGKSIAKEDRSTLDPTPGHTRARDTASAWAMFLSRAINWATGGTDYTPGTMSPTPDAVDYFIEQLTGGIGRELSKSSQVLQSMITGEELPFHKIPLAGRFAGSVSGTTAIRDRFYDNIKEVNLAYREFEGRAKDHKPNAHEFLRLHPTGRLHEAAISVERTIGELQQAKHDLVKKGAPREAIRLREQQITGMMERFNRLVEARQPGASTQD